MIPMKISDTKFLERTTQELENRIPPGWKLQPLMKRGPNDATIRVTSSEGRSHAIPVVLEPRIDPRTARQLSPDPELIVMAPYLSRAVRDVLEERGASYVDQTGNIRVVLSEPGLFILTAGANTNPWPDKRKLTLRGVKAGRVVRALAAKRPPVGVRELATLASTDPGYVSRLLQMLDSEAIVERTSRGQVEQVDWRRLLMEWSKDAPLSDRAAASTWLAPRGLQSVFERLRTTNIPYLLTGSAAASQLAPIAPTRLLSLYVDDPEQAAKALGLTRTEAGANVILMRSEDDKAFVKAEEVQGLKQAPLPLIAADLLTGPGRSPAEAEALMDWMEANEEVWRG